LLNFAPPGTYDIPPGYRLEVFADGADQLKYAPAGIPWAIEHESGYLYFTEITYEEGKGQRIYVKHLALYSRPGHKGAYSFAGPAQQGGMAELEPMPFGPTRLPAPVPFAQEVTIILSGA
jgi:hypothetical protein